MRNTLISSFAIIAACTNSPEALKDPPLLVVSSPARSTIQANAGMVTVTGMASPNAQGTTLQKVLVNDVNATLNPDGSFTANIQIEEGATLIHTVATDAAGTTASDTRSIEAGAIHTPGSMVPKAITASISAPAFAKIAGLASSLIKQEDFGKLLAPMQPMLNTGGSCLGAKGYIDGLTMSNAVITLVPVSGGLSFSAEIDGLNVKGHADFDVACIGGSDSFGVTADKVVVTATLDVQPNGMMGFNTTLANTNVSLTNLNVSAGGLPGAILNLIDFNALASLAIEKGAGLFMGPMVNSALGALAGPQKLNLLGKTIDLQVQASAVSFDQNAGSITLDSKFLIEGSENSAGFVYTSGGSPAMDPGAGMAIGLSNNLANEALQQLTAIGLLNLAMPAPGGTFDTANIAATSAPMISGDPASGKLMLVLPDMMATFTAKGAIVGKAALNATVELKVTPASNGYAVAIDLGAPVIYIDTLNDVANETHLTNTDLSTAVDLSLNAQIASVSALLGSIPIPAVAGLQLHDLSIDSDSGYVMVKGTLQ